MYLLAVSGGPDSMFLLNQFKRKNIIVAHVNYNQRKNAIQDQNIVIDFCKQNHISYQVLKVKDQPSGNFQAWARTVRLTFFKDIYIKNNCKKLIIAHHKDDFLETAIMQQASGRTPRFFGIRKHHQIQEMKIWRPYVDKYWKNDLVTSNNKNQIKFAIDSSNQKLIYKRNQIRNMLSQKQMYEKQSMFEWFVMSNKILKKKFKSIDNKVTKINKSNHCLKMYQKLNLDIKEVLYEIIHQELGDVKLSTPKINALIDFIKAKVSHKKFIINNQAYIYKKNDRLIYYGINSKKIV